MNLQVESCSFSLKRQFLALPEYSTEYHTSIFGTKQVFWIIIFKKSFVNRKLLDKYGQLWIILFKYCITLVKSFSSLSLIFKSINTSMLIFHRNINFYLHCNRSITLVPREYMTSQYLIVRYMDFIFQTEYGFNQLQHLFHLMAY